MEDGWGALPMWWDRCGLWHGSSDLVTLSLMVLCTSSFYMLERSHRRFREGAKKLCREMRPLQGTSRLRICFTDRGRRSWKAPLAHKANSVEISDECWGENWTRTGSCCGWTANGNGDDTMLAQRNNCETPVHSQRCGHSCWLRSLTPRPACASPPPVPQSLRDDFSVPGRLPTGGQGWLRHNPRFTGLYPRPPITPL
jgi:hypothetical protein